MISASLRCLARTVSRRPPIIACSRPSHPNKTTVAVSVKLLPVLHIKADVHMGIGRYSKMFPSITRKHLRILLDIGFGRSWPYSIWIFAFPLSRYRFRFQRIRGRSTELRKNHGFETHLRNSAFHVAAFVFTARQKTNRFERFFSFIFCLFFFILLWLLRLIRAFKT